MTKYSIIIIFLIFHALLTISQCEVYYIGCSQSPKDADHHLTLTQFVKNSSNYLTNDTQLIFAPGNYSLESEILIENVQSFSISVEPILSSRAFIICDSNARFEFKNVSMVTLSGLDLIGCFETYTVLVGHFLIENSRFHDQAVLNGSILTIEASTATLDRVAFISYSTIDSQDNVTFMSSESCPTDLPCRATIILSRRSVVVVTQSWFEGNNMGLGSGIEYHDSDITIFNTTFINNSVAIYCNYNTCFTGGIVRASGLQESTLKLYNTRFIQNIGVIIFPVGDKILLSSCEFIDNSAPSILLLARYTNMTISHTEFIGNDAAYSIAYIVSGITTIDHSKFINNIGRSIVGDVNTIKFTHNEFIENTVKQGSLVILYGDVITLSHSEFVNNIAGSLFDVYGDMITLSHSEFVNNTAGLLIFIYGEMITLIHSELVNNTVGSLIDLYGDVIIVSHSKFVKNTDSHSGFTGILYIGYNIMDDKLNITKNEFIDNSAAYAVLVRSQCKPGFSLSLGSPRCIKCPLKWQKNVTIIVVVSIAAGIAIVIFMLALNMTVAVGTLNGILFYVHIVTANANTYFFPFRSPNFITVFISWLNLETGFDICVYEEMDPIIKGLIQLAFPFYIICLVIIVIVASECSSKFAKIIGKGNPVAVLATMILLSYARLLNAIFGSVYLAYYWPAYGSRGIDLSATLHIGAEALKQESNSFQAKSYSLIVILILILIFVILFTALVSFWQWFLLCQDKVICKWVKYQKLRHFIEPYHAPYTAKYRYWTGLLLFIRVLLSFISSIYFSFDDPQIPVELLSTIIVIGGLLLLKGMIATRVYKNWPLDVIETVIYFNLLAFSSLTWYNISSQAATNQIAVAYTSVMIIFILLLGVIVFHVFRYTRLYKCSFVEKAFKWIFSRLLEKKPQQQAPNDAPEELDGYQFERPDDQELPTVTYSVIEIHQPDKNQEAQNETAY